MADERNPQRPRQAPDPFAYKGYFWLQKKTATLRTMTSGPDSADLQNDVQLTGSLINSPIRAIIAAIFISSTLSTVPTFF